MIDGTYTIVLKTPVGEKRGNIIFKSKDDVLKGYLQIGFKKTPIEPGSIKDHNFHFKGSFDTMLIGLISYECSGKLDGNKISGKVKCKKGTFPFAGTKKS